MAVLKRVFPGCGARFGERSLWIGERQRFPANDAI